MFPIVVLGMMIAAASAGVIGDYGSPYGGHGGAVVVAPSYVHAAPIAVKHAVATSYANSNSISIGATPVHVAHAPVVHAAPAYVHAAPLVHAAPVVLGHGYGGLGGFGGLGGHGGYYGH